MDKIVLASTHKGFMRIYFPSLLLFVALLWIVSSGISYIVASIIVLFNFHIFFYRATEVNTIFKDARGHWGKVFCKMYGFPFAKETRQVLFDRIIEIGVEQSSIDRILDTGTLHLKVITFTNAAATEYEWTIPAIENPYEKKEAVEAALLGHEGLNVTFTQELAATA